MSEETVGGMGRRYPAHKATRRNADEQCVTRTHALRPCALAILAAALFAVLPSSPAKAALPGVNVAGAPTPSVLQEAINTGAKRVRIFALWRDLEPSAAGQYPGSSPLTAVFDDAIRQLNAAGAQPIFVVTEAPQWANGSTDPFVPPTNPQDYANVLKQFAIHNANVGQVAAYEIWNEEDEDTYWHPSPSAPAYAALLKAAYSAARPYTPADTQILAGPFTGNNYEWLDKLYDNGAQGHFDGVSVHTDTACLVNGPDEFYREGNRLARFTFLGYREVRNTLLAHGDDKPVWMTELGWSSTKGGATSCTRGKFAGQKPSGVSEADQAGFLTHAFQCLANDPYVPVGAWFTMKETAGLGDELNHYGLQRADASLKPAYNAFKALAASGGGSAGTCGDFDAPAIQIQSPAPGEQFVDKLDVRAAAADSGVGLARISFGYDAGQEIRNFTENLRNGTAVGLAPWNGSGKLPVGKHTLIVTALDKNGNTSRATVDVEKVKTLASTMTPTFKLAKKVKCKGRACTFSGALAKGASGPTINGKVSVEWQFRNKQGKWRKLAGGLKPANKRFNFRAKLKQSGRWRVRAVYGGKAPWKKTASTYVAFTVR
jgi:hypothetical protein